MKDTIKKVLYILIILFISVIFFFGAKEKDVIRKIFSENIKKSSETTMEDISISFENKKTNHTDRKITLLAEISAVNGIKKIIRPDETEIYPENKNKLALDIELEEKKDYTFKIIDNMGKEAEKTLNITIPYDPVIKVNPEVNYEKYLTIYMDGLRRNITGEIQSENATDENVKLYYKVDSGEWQLYNGKMDIGHGETFYAKSVYEKDGILVESKVISKNVPFASDALKYPTGQKLRSWHNSYIQIDPNVKKVNMVFTYNRISPKIQFIDSSGNILIAYRGGGTFAVPNATTKINIIGGDETGTDYAVHINQLYAIVP